MNTETVTFVCEMCSTVENCADRFTFSGMYICIECYSQDEEPDVNAVALGPVSACHRHYLAGIYDCDICRVTDPISECLSFIIERIQDEETNAIKETECPICMEQFVGEDADDDDKKAICGMYCKHLICSADFNTIALSSNSCPICRVKLLVLADSDDEDEIENECPCCFDSRDNCDCVDCPCGEVILFGAYCGNCNRTHCQNCNVFNQMGCATCHTECEICGICEPSVILRARSNQDWCAECNESQVACSKCGCWMSETSMVDQICADCEDDEDA